MNASASPPCAVAVTVPSVRTGTWASGVMLKSTSEMSKKMLPRGSILIRAWPVERLGIRTDSAPSFGALAARTVGKVSPPSLESEILTFAALTGAAAVPATFHVMARIVFPDHVRAVFGCVTWNRPGGPCGSSGLLP